MTDSMQQDKMKSDKFKIMHELDRKKVTLIELYIDNMTMKK